MNRHWTTLIPVGIWIGALTLGCGGSDSGGTTTATTDTSTSDGTATLPAPTLTIDAPADGAVVSAGAAVHLEVTVAQAGGDLARLDLEWTTDRAAAPLARLHPDAAGRAVADVATLAAGAHALTATVRDAAGQAASATVHVTVDTPPTAPVVTIEPATPTTTDDLRAVITTEATDADGAVTLSYRWLVDGADAQLRTAVVPAAATTKGQVWQVAVQAEDTHGGIASATAEVTVGNSPPTCAQAVVLPAAGTTTTTFTCRCADRDDPDGEDVDPPADTCAFLVGGEPLATDGACSLDAALTERGMAVTCELTPGDGEAAGTPTESGTFDVMNAAPSAPEVSLAPATPTDHVDATTELACKVTTPGVDPDGDSVSHVIRWTVGAATATVNGAAASGAYVVAGDLATDAGAGPVHAKHGDSVRCGVSASDGSDASSVVQSAPIVLANAAPVVDNVLVAPIDEAGVVEGHAVRCTAGEARDADGDPLTLTITWLVGDAAVAGQTGETLASDHFAKGDVLRCQIAATDGTASSATVTSKNQLTVKNSAPAIGSATLTPASPKKTDALSCAYAGWSDADGDAAGATFAWVTVQGGATAPIAGQTGATLAAGVAPVGAGVRCIVTPTDGADAGAPVESNTVTIANTTPTLASATLGPDAARATSTLTCTPAGFADADGDSPVYAYAWTKNAAPIAGQTGATLAGAFAKGDHVRCVVTPGDGVATGAAVTSNELVIANTPPTLASVTLTPLAGSLCGTYTCTPGAVTDPDAADLTSVRYRWEKNGLAVAGASSATLTGTAAGLVAGDALRCFAAPSDGTLDNGQPVYGAELPSSAASADNAPPMLAGATLTPVDAGVGTQLTCAGTGWQDDCQASPDVTYQWYVDAGLVAGQTGATLATTDLALGAKVRCRVTPKDALTAGTPADSAVVTLGPGAAVAPVVEVQAPEGSAGEATCAIVVAEKWFTAPTYTWYWSVNGVESVGTQTLPAASTFDCDLVACRVVVQDARSSLSSQLAALQLPVGLDCEDGNDCTSHVCDPAGGCGAPVPEDAIACRAEDACKPIGVCVAGECVAEGNVCVEEPINIAAASEPRVAGLLDGGYVTQWTVGATGATRFRVTDPSDSRRDEEVDPLTSTVLSGAHPTVTPAALASGGFAVAEFNGSLSAWSSWYGTSSNAAVNLHTYGADGAEVDNDVSLYSLAVACSPYCGIWPSGASFCGGCSTDISHLYARPLELADGLALVASGITHKSEPVPYNTTNTYVYAPVSLVPTTGVGAGTPVTLVAGARLHNERRLAAAALPAASDTLAVTWVGPGDNELRVQRFVKGASGLTAGTELLVRTGEGKITTPQLASFYDGSFLVAWTEASTSSGKEVYVQRFDTSAAASGSPIRVNAVTTGDQVLGGLDTFFDFGFVATYTDSRVDGPTDAGVVARLFSASATPGTPIALNTTTAGAQGQSTVATLADDEWLAAWVDAPSGAVMTRRFDRDGFPLPGLREELPAENVNGDQARIDGAASKQDKVLLAWDTALFPGQDTEIATRLFTADGLPLGPELVLNATTADAQRTPAVAGGDDRFVVAWESLSEDGSGYGIYARRLDGAGQPVGDPFRVNDTTANNQLRPAIAMRADGSFLIAWDGFVNASQKTEVYAKAYDKNGAVLVNETLLNATTAAEQERPDVAVNPATNAWVVAWQSKNQVAADSGFDLFARTVTPGASAAAPTLGSERQLNTTTTGDQKEVTLGVSPSGFLAACWEDGAPDLTCQTFTASSMVVKTAEFPVAALTAGAQQSATLAYASDGKLLVAWESDNVDREGKGIQLRHFSAQGPASGIRVLANRYVKSDETRPCLVPLAGGRFIIAWQSLSQDGSGLGVVFRSLWAP